ncbi:acyl-CoA dehydrogenase family protein [Quadrisphaera oryzae]|uniref:acyl-CoA dehydrogenase family protein n=1 Tax=Quadrisphaera TaxID=317661 RepID=UPI001647CFD9|nr:acyl-CoA dehydrogenase family protein [Quadrisphaera sp. RL12-1S]MBC3760277.1 acyl-CoA dehydrogenase family protein [Quadrisphaera sp. RL12-1S]
MSTTTQPTAQPTAQPTTQAERLAAARARLQPVFDAVVRDVVQREVDHQLPREQVEALVAAGFTRLRVPVEHGGDGLDLVSFTELMIDLAAVDSNLPQIFRGQVAWVEHLLSLPEGPYRDAWFARVAAGEWTGNAWSETGGTTLGGQSTKVRRDADGRWRVSGRKYYTTGTIYAGWTDVVAQLTDEATVAAQEAGDAAAGTVTALVRLDQPGVTVSDDWDGFGQQLTGTGTLVLEDAVVAEDDLAPFDDRFRYQTALYQLVLLAVHAGIAAAVERDTAHEVRSRTRSYSHGLAPVVREDPQVLAVAGEISSVAFAARAIALAAASAVQGAADTAHDRDSEADLAANVRAEIATAQAQVVLSESVPRAATLLFNTLGASGTSRAKDLDRHWRNARTVASHNPVIYKTRIVGDWSVNGTTPPFVWAIGTHTQATAAPQR